MKFFEDFYKIKYYVLVIMLLFGTYVWAGITGTKFTGDDNSLKEERNSSHRGHGVFYHK